MARSVALRVGGEWAFASAVLLANARLEAACIPAGVLLLAAAAVPAVRSHSTALATTASTADDWFAEMARPVALRWNGVSASAQGCLCDVAGTLAPPLLRCITATPLRCSGQSVRLGHCVFSPQPEERGCYGKRLAVNVFYAAILRQRLSNDVPEPFFFTFFFPETVLSEPLRNHLVYLVRRVQSTVCMVFCTITYDPNTYKIETALQ